MGKLLGEKENSSCKLGVGDKSYRDRRARNSEYEEHEYSIHGQAGLEIFKCRQ